MFGPSLATLLVLCALYSFSPLTQAKTGDVPEANNERYARDASDEMDKRYKGTVMFGKRGRDQLFHFGKRRDKVFAFGKRGPEEDDEEANGVEAVALPIPEDYLSKYYQNKRFTYPTDLRHISFEDRESRDNPKKIYFGKRMDVADELENVAVGTPERRGKQKTFFFGKREGLDEEKRQKMVYFGKRAASSASQWGAKSGEHDIPDSDNLVNRKK